MWGPIKNGPRFEAGPVGFKKKWRKLLALRYLTPLEEHEASQESQT
jgi:hypothetical protein